MMRLVDADGQPVRLTERIGKGGEGSVYDIAGHSSFVAKVYHHTPLPPEQVAKFETMISLFSKPLGAVSAWPRALIYDATRFLPCGIVMPKVASSRQLHELYGTTSRRRHFPGVAWHHMVLAARNTAAAFHTVQETGVVVGDVNQGNLLVDEHMCVRLIDCDSFQIRRGSERYACPVGTPHFTPPELQSIKLRDVERTTNHDGFGLAVLIFHLLFMGRHPFAGRFLGQGDMTIERAIAERRFAFSRNKAETLVDPPPASLLLEDLPPEIGDLFERAFRSDDQNGQLRPTPAEWVTVLEALMKQRKPCRYDEMHVFYAGLSECPWCRIEDFGGPSFFVPSGETTLVNKSRLEELNRRVLSLRKASFPDLAPSRLELPSMPGLKRSKKKPPLSVPDVLSGVMALAGALCLGGVWSGYALLAGTVLAAAAATLLLLEAGAKTRRRQVEEFEAWLEQGKHEIWQAGQKILDRHNKSAEAFARSTEELEQQTTDYQAEGKALVKVLVSHGDAQLDEVLRGRMLRDHYRDIEGLGPSMVALLESYGVESAYDVEKVVLYGVPMVTPDLMSELLQWREGIERDFVFKPHHGVTPEELEVATEAATQRYKMSQARRVLMGASHLEEGAKSAERSLRQQLREFDAQVNDWREVGKQLRDFQSIRRPLERRLNASPTSIVVTAIVLPAIGFFAWIFFG